MTVPTPGPDGRPTEWNMTVKLAWNWVIICRDEEESANQPNGPGPQECKGAMQYKNNTRKLCCKSLFW